jgi:hypothetical protein
MLPNVVLAVREVGDTEAAYWSAASPDGIQLLLEPGESLLHVGYCRVSQVSPKGWSLPDATTVVVTDRRTAFLTTRFDQGGGWAGFGLAGLAVATTANVVSKRRAAARSAGQVAVGQARHEWLTAINLRRRKALIGAVDTYVDLTVASSAGPRVIELWGKLVVNEKFARWLAGVVSEHRTTLLPPESAQEIATLQRYKLGGQDTASTGKQNDLGWFFPGKTDDLIVAVIARLAAASAPSRPPSSGA